MCVCVGGGGVHTLIFDIAMYNFGSKTEALLCDGFAKTQTHERFKRMLISYDIDNTIHIL